MSKKGGKKGRESCLATDIDGGNPMARCLDHVLVVKKKKREEIDINNWWVCAGTTDNGRLSSLMGKLVNSDSKLNT